MSSHFYYFISSLPALRLEASAPISSAEFLVRVRMQVPADSARALESLAETPPVPVFCPAVRRWNQIEIYIRNYILRNREDSDRRRVEEWTRPEDDVFPGLNPQLDDALNAPNPLERERRLDRIRWNWLEEMRFARPFELDALAVYRLWLLMVEKWAAVDPEKGLQRVQDIAHELRPREQLQAAGIA